MYPLWVLGITRIAPITTYHQALMKKHLPIDQQFSLMDTKLNQIIEGLDELLAELGCTPGELGEDLGLYPDEQAPMIAEVPTDTPWPGY